MDKEETMITATNDNPIQIIFKTRYGDIVILTYSKVEQAWIMDCSNVAYTSIIWDDNECKTIRSVDPEGLFHIGIGSLLKHNELGQHVIYKVEPIIGTGNYKLFVK